MRIVGWRFAGEGLVVGVALVLGVGCDAPRDAPRPPRDESPVCAGRSCDDNLPRPGEHPHACEEASCACVVGSEGGFCTTPYCAVVVEPDIVGRDVSFEVHEISRSTGELLGGRACRVSTPAAGTDFARPFEVAIRYDSDDVPWGFAESEVIAVAFEPEPTIAWDGVVDASRDRVAIGSLGSLTLGASVLPAQVVVQGELGLDRFEVDSPAAFIRNVSRYDFGATFHDGGRFYVANGPRVLIYEGGIPADPTALPDVVLGRPTLEEETYLPSASSFGGAARGIWSDGERLVVTEGNRALIWNEVPTVSFMPADVVLGQRDFSSNLANRGEDSPAADTLHQPDGVWSDGLRLVVSDTQNHRHLVWETFPIANGTPADLVIGQEDFDERLVRGSSAPTHQARGAYFDGSRFVTTSTYGCNCLWAFDGFPTVSNPAPDYLVGFELVVNRVTPFDFVRLDALDGFGQGGLIARDGWRASVWRSFPTGNEPPDFFLGKPDGHLGGAVGRVSAAAFGQGAPSAHVATEGDRLVLSDGPRLLVYDSLPDASFVPADRVIGQPTAATVQQGIDYRGIGRDTVAAPGGISVSGDVTVVADRGNARVLVIRGALDAPASVVVVGQPSATEFSPGGGWSGTHAAELADPTDVFTDGVHLVVADAGNHRVLVWDALPTEDGTAADRVLGQPGLSTGRPNRGAADADGDGDVDATASSLHYPSGVFADASGLYVADTYNHRVVVYPPLTEAGDPLPLDVLGQPDFQHNDPNAGLGWFERSGDTLARPTDVTRLPDGELAIVDGQNNRVVIYDGNGPIAVLGQPDDVSNVSPEHHTGASIGFPMSEVPKRASAATLRTPYSAFATKGSLYVADTGNHRVMRFDYPLASGMNASGVWGQPDFEHRLPNEGGIGAASLSRPEGLAVGPSGALVITDTDNHRIIQAAEGAPASTVFGQPDLFTNGPNRAAPAEDTLSAPGAVSWDGSRLWVADTGHHRLMAYDSSEVSVLVGQSDLAGDLPNGGSSLPTASSLSSPAGLWTDGTSLVVADRDNHRVLIWNTLPSARAEGADIVVGQADFTSGEPNAGAGFDVPSDTSLLFPEAVWVGGGSLFVADTGNNRVLRWDTIPTDSGTPADAVFCQGGFDQGRSNRGGSTAESATCAGPSSLIEIGGTLWVADTGNHRVVSVDSAFASGASASQVVGQPDFFTRLPVNADLAPDAATMSSPVGLAWDGDNLYVSEADNHRILVFDELPAAPGVSADRVIGQVAFDERVITPEPRGLDGPRGIAVLPLPHHSTKLWVADRGKDRVVVFEGVARRF